MNVARDSTVDTIGSQDEASMRNPASTVGLTARQLGLERPPTVGPRLSILDALGLLMAEPSQLLLTSDEGRPAVLTRADLERFLPSPATTLDLVSSSSAAIQVMESRSKRF